MNNNCNKITLLLILFGIASAMRSQTISHSTLLSQLQSIQKQLVPDKRVAILDIEIKDTIQWPLIIRGETNLPEAKNRLLKHIVENEFRFVDSIKVLPNAILGSSIWALSKLSVANIRTKPDDASEMATQILMGTPVKVLDKKNNWYRIQTPEGYIGWTDASGLQLLTESQLGQWKTSARCVFNQTYGTVYASARNKGEVVSDAVLGNLYQVDGKTIGRFKVTLPDGRRGFVSKKYCISFEKWSSQTPQAKSIIATAKQMMGSPYLWGGTSSKAIDCSGLVKLAYYSHGIILARDASQQVKYGEVIDFTNINNLQTGDLLFFGRTPQRVTHVGIYLGHGDFIHASGMVHISSIIPTDAKFVPTRNLVAARRLLNSINTEGIMLVKNHPWYAIQP